MQTSREERRRINPRRPKRNRRDSVFTSNSTNRAMKSDVTVQLDKTSYVAGDVISGSVNVILTQEVKIKALSVRIYGSSRVSWDEQRSYTKGSATSVSCKNTETYLDHAIVLLRKDRNAGSLTQNDATRVQQEMTSHSTSASLDTDDGVFLSAGDHNFRFEYMLPHGLPSSYEGKWGQIKYSAKSVLERPWRFDIEREQEFTLRAHTDLNEEPELARPIGALGEFTAGFLCIKRGFVNVEVRLNRRGFVPGDTINCMVEIENGSTHKLYGVKLTLQQHATFRVGKKTKKVSHPLATICKGDISENETTAWKNETLTIPGDIPPSTNKSIKSIHIKYTVTLHVTYSSWREEYTLPVVIIIGTEAIRRAVVHGNSTPRQTPAGSPRVARTKPAPNEHAKHSMHATLPTLMTRDQLHMRRASAYPGAVPNATRHATLPCDFTNRSQKFSSNTSLHTKNDTKSKNVAQYLSPFVDSNRIESQRQFSGSECLLPAERSHVNTDDILIIIEGERLNKKKEKGQKGKTFGEAKTESTLSLKHDTPKRGSLDART